MQFVLSLDGDDPETGAAATRARRLISSPQQLIVAQGPRSSITGTLNRGLSHCIAPFITLLEAIDLCMPEHLAQQADALGANPQLVAVGMQIQRVNRLGQNVTDRFHHYPSNPESTLLM